MRTVWGTIAIGLLAGIAGAYLVTGGLLPALETPRSATPRDTNTQSPALLSDQEALVVSAVKKAAPAVVSIVITQDVPVVERFFDEVPLNPFSPFNFRVPRLEQRGTEERQVGGGSGFIVSADGYIITNRHVVNQENASYTVFTNDGTSFTATVVARDPSVDLAVLKIDATGLPFLTFANSDQLQVGQSVIAIGNALAEFQNSVSTGVVSGLSRSIIAGSSGGATEQLEEVIQTDAAINPGNSGGPLLNLSGDVIGVNVAVALGSENIGFALPANLASSIVDDVQQTGRIVRPFLGVRYTAITPALAEQNGLPVEAGIVLVSGSSADESAVVPNSPAARAGLQEGDIITAFDGTQLDSTTSLASLIRHHEVGDTVAITFLRDDTEQTVTLTLAEAPQG